MTDMEFYTPFFILYFIGNVWLDNMILFQTLFEHQKMHKKQKTETKQNRNNSCYQLLVPSLTSAIVSMYISISATVFNVSAPLTRSLRVCVCVFCVCDKWGEG